MNRASLSVGVLVLLIILGCGGSGSGNTGTVDLDQLAAEYDGAVKYSNGAGDGISVVISNTGTITGSEPTGTGFTPPWQLAGNVQSSGRFTMTATLAGSPDKVYTGKLSLGSGDHLDGSGNMIQNFVNVSFTFALPGPQTVSTTGGFNN